LANSECCRAGGNANERRTEDTGATMKRHHASTDRDKNGKAYTASVKTSQQNKPMPTVLRRSPRASMVVAPCVHGYTGCAFHHHRGAGLDMELKRGGVAAMQIRLG
jgi:hypothetical protein